MTKTTRQLPLAIALLFAATACNPTVVVTRLKLSPPRHDACSLWWSDASTLALTQTHTQVGSVAFGGPGADELSEFLRETLRERACAMGGEVISLGIMRSGPVTGDGSLFWVWKRK